MSLNSSSDTSPIENINIQVEDSNPPIETDNITIGLLSNIKNLIDVAVSRGAYRPNELSSVGKIYDHYIAGLIKLQTQNKLSVVEDNKN